MFFYMLKVNMSELIKKEDIKLIYIIKALNLSGTKKNSLKKSND